MTLLRGGNDSRPVDRRPGTHYHLRRSLDGEWSMRETRDSEAARAEWLRNQAVHPEMAFGTAHADELKEMAANPPQSAPVPADEAATL